MSECKPSTMLSVMPGPQSSKLNDNIITQLHHLPSNPPPGPVSTSSWWWRREEIEDSVQSAAPPCKMRSRECAEVTVNKQLQSIYTFYLSSSSSHAVKPTWIIQFLALHKTLGMRPPPSRKVYKRSWKYFYSSQVVVRPARCIFGALSAIWIRSSMITGQHFGRFYYFICHIQMPSTFTSPGYIL